MWLLARNDELNQWLAKNPLVVAAIFGVLGVVLAITGAMSFFTGTARGKYGEQMTGGMAYLTGAARFIAGLFCLGYAIYHLVV